jgi:hypothetical protein
MALRRSGFEQAREFIAKNARLLDRHRFAFLFDRASPDAVVAALRPYQNPDGGFGHALEPDLRTPLSQPIPTWTALWILDEAGRFDPEMVERALAYLAQIEVPGGGVPFVLRTASDAPHAPWWETGRGKLPASINPTAGIAAVLFKHKMRSPWLDRAAAWCWQRIDRMRAVNPYEMRVTLSFLDHVPDRDRAGQALERLRPKILSKGMVELDVRSKKDAFRPLDYAPEPGLLSRELFSGTEIEHQLDGLERAQRADGGWAIHFPIWTPITRFEWRGCQTVDMLKILQRNGRLGSAA